MTEPTVGAFTRHDAHLLALRMQAERTKDLIDDLVAGRWLACGGLSESERAVVVHFLEVARDRLLETIARHEAQR